MTLIGSRATMKHLITIQRNSNLDADPWGLPSAPDWFDYLLDVPCKAWTEGNVRERTAALDPTDTQVVETRKALVPLGTDVIELDRVSDIKHSNGDVFLPGPMVIEAVLTFEDHIQLTLKYVVRILG